MDLKILLRILFSGYCILLYFSIHGYSQAFPLLQPICAADEPKVLCVIRDMTNETHQTKFNLNMPGSMSVRAFAEEVAKKVGYQPGSFSLTYEKQEVGAQAEVTLLTLLCIYCIKLTCAVLYVGTHRKYFY